MAKELSGAGGLSGTYPFDLARSVKAYRLNRFLHGLIVPAHRQAFLADPEVAFEQAGLSHYGVIFFMLEKLGAVIGVSNLHIYAAMRGESLEDFQKTRNAPGALYSVAGQDSKTLSWNT